MSQILVDFVIVGAQKCGTTSLAEHLSQLSSISFCKEKEPHYFSKINDWQKHLDEYHKLYKQEKNKIYGEASTTYSFCDEYPNAISNLHKYNNNMKLIYIIRDPVARIESHYNHRLRNGKLNSSFIDAIGTHPCFIERSRYYYQLQHIYKTFPKDQVQILFFDDLIIKPHKVISQACEFLKVLLPKESEIDLTPKNVSDASLKLDSSIAKWTIKLLEKMPFSHKFARLIPIKKRAKQAEKILLWNTVQKDIEQLKSQMEGPFDTWIKKYKFSNDNRLQ